jgi:RNA polymerase sigma-70 factor (ECF subfamily)
VNSVAVRTTRTTDNNAERGRRFRDAALPHLDAAYTLARYLLRDPSDAEDAVQECYLRALRHFDTLRGADVKPWLLAILRNVCRVEFGRRSRLVVYDVSAEEDEASAPVPLWREPHETPEAELLRKLDRETIRGMVAALPETFREVIVLRDLEGLPYREIAEVVDAPVGTVMSRLARGRAMLRQAWLTAPRSDEQAKERDQHFKPPREEPPLGAPPARSGPAYRAHGGLQE